MRVALIRNPRSQRNRSDAFGTISAEVLQAEPATPEALLQALREFAAQGVNLLMVSGGDGTLREVVTALPLAYGERLPAIALLAAGNANLVAADVGTAGHGAAAVDAVLKAASMQTFSRREVRPLLTVSWPDGSHAPVQGFFVGAAALSRATRYAHERVLARGWTHGVSVAFTIVGALLQSLRKGNAWMSGAHMGIAYDGAEAREGARFLFLATSLHRLVLGLWPFWNDGEGTVGPLHHLEMDAPPWRLVRSLPRLARGKPSPAMLGHGYRSACATTIALQLDEPLIVDGEPFAIGPSGRLHLSAGPRIEFLTP